MSITKNLISFGALSLAAIVLASCATAPAAPPPTLAILPSLTPTTVPSEAAPTEVVVAATATERPTARWYAIGAELIPVYDCADTACGIIATYEDGEPVDVYTTVELWHEIRLPDGSSAFMLYGTISQSEPTAEPSATGSVTARPTRTLIPSRTASSTLTSTATPSATATSTATRTATSTGTPANTFTPFPTLPLQGPSQGRPVLPGGTVDEPGYYPTSTAPAPGTPGYIPPTLTWTPSRTLLPSVTSTLSAPPGGGSPPPTVLIVPTVTSQPGGSTPPPGAGNPVPTSNAPPPGSTPPPGAGNPIPTSNAPPPPPGPPPGA